MRIKRTGDHGLFRLMWKVTVLSTAVLCGASAAQTGVGYHAAPFLKINPAARSTAMGEAFTAMTGDANLMRFNVGGLGGLKTASLGANFNSWIGDTQQGNIAFAYPIGRDRADSVGLSFRDFAKYGVVAIDLTYFDEGKIEQLDPFFTPLGGNGISGDMMAALGYGKYFPLGRTQLGLGIAGKFLSQNLVGENSSVWAFDAGLQFMPMPYFTLGAAVQNLSASKIKFDVWKSPLPETYRTGAALCLPIGGGNEYSEFMLSGDVVWTRKEQAKFLLGSEVVISDIFALRAGYKLKETSTSVWAAGFGLNIPLRAVNNSLMRLDYAYAPLPAFDEAAHRLSLHFAFKALPEILYAEDLLKRQEMIIRDLEKEKETLDSLRKDLEKKLRDVQTIIGGAGGPIVETGIDRSPEGVPTGYHFMVFFDFDQAAIRPSEIPTLKRVAEILNKFPDSKIQLSGHTDWIGEEDYNIQLSQRRLNSVIDYLTKIERIDPKRFFMPVGYGESRPIAGNTTEEGRQRNRRVEFNVYFKGTEPTIPDGTAIRNVRAIDERTIEIECNGRIKPGKPLVLTDPDRYALTFENVFLLTDQKEIPLNKGPFIRARLGYTADASVKFSRVVFDTRYPIDGDQTVKDNLIIFKLKPKLEQSLEKKN